MYEAELENEYQDLPEPEHVATVMDGLIDTVSGNEGYTYAQRYLHSCLQSSGGLSSRTGVEGFFESLGNGIKKIWEYIKKMFKSIWEFLFGKGEKSASASQERTKKKVDVVLEGVKATNEAPKTTQEGNKKIRAVKARVTKIMNRTDTPASDKHKAAEVIAHLDEAHDKEPSVQVSVIRKSVNDMAKLARTKERIEGAHKLWTPMYDKWQAKIEEAHKGVDWRDSKVGKEYEEFAKSIRSQFPALRAQKEALFPKTLESINDAVKALEQLRDDTQEWGKEGSLGRLAAAHVQKVEHTINELEHELSKEGGRSQEEINKDLAATKVVLELATNLTTIVNQEAELCSHIATMLDLGFNGS